MEGRPKTSFQKKGAPKFPNIPGTKPSLYNYQLLSSTGVPALDNLLGGGLPVGTLILIEDHPRPEGEDETDIGSDYSTVLLKYFMCEGAAHQHSLFFGSCCEKPERFFSNLPEVVVKASSLSETPASEQPEDIKIAWRYKSLPSAAANEKSASHAFNLQKTLSKNVLEKCDTFSWSPPTSLGVENSDFYRQIYAKLESISEGVQFSLAPVSGPDNSKNILRISIQNLGSLLWAEEENENCTKLTTFIFALRSLARQHLFICLLTISQDCLLSLATKGAAIARVRSLCDVVIQLTPFNKQERKNGLFKDYHGILNLLKFANLSCLRSPVQLNCGKYLFKSTRTKFVIEKMHLPPDLGAEEKKPDSANKLDF